MRLRATVAYDGSGFRGFARNEGVATVQAVLEEALGRVVRVPVSLTCAGRTDAGVHAWGQVIGFDAPEGTDVLRLQRSVNELVGPVVVLREVSVAAAGFDARHDARWRSYRYTILNRPVPDPFRVATAWWVPQPLDLALLRLGCDPFIGEHDFSSFCRRPGPQVDGTPRSLVRRVLDARWVDEGQGVLRFDIRATSFCHQMVRSIVGTVVETGLGRRRPGELLGILAARDRGAAGRVAPPHGLCLWEVGY